MWKEYHFLIPPRIWKRNFKYLINAIFGNGTGILDPLNRAEYSKWLKASKKKTEYEELKYRPLISVLVPVFNVEARYLKECVESILGQSYDNFEICIVDDASSNKETLALLRGLEENEKIRIKYRKENGHISRATNDALEMARGEFVALVDNDDVLEPDALYEVVRVLNKNRGVDFIYTDEDKISVDGEYSDPNFKSDFALDSFYSSNYISHLAVLRKTIVEEIGGFREGFEGAQDYDLYLRFFEKSKRILHVPKVLYHWRMIPGSTAMENSNKNYALERGRRAVEESLKRQGVKGEVKIAKDCPYYYIEYALSKEPVVSIIIPTKDLAKITEKCLESIYKKTTYKKFEVIVMNNRSEEKVTFELFDRYKSKYDNFRVIDADFEFNYAKINNLAVRESRGEYLILLNNDVEIVTENWIEVMVGYASQKHVGAVGAKLLYPDDTIQHGGVIMGLGGVASHAFVGSMGDAVVWGGRLSVPYNYSAVTGACLVVAKKKWEEVGGMDEKLKVAYNDVDFCLKLLRAGYYNVLVPMVKLYHYESKTRGADDKGEKKVRFDWEQDFMYKKWSGEIKNDVFYNPNYSRRVGYKLDLE